MLDGARKSHRATYEDLLKAPRHLVAELVDGELVTSPRPSGRHARASSTLGMDIGTAFQRGRGGPGGWWILDEPELHLADPEPVVVPDLAGWRRERMPVVPDAPWFELAPDWVCEVLSPSTAHFDRVVKMPRYARAGIQHLWLVDPIHRVLEVYVQRDGLWIVRGAFGGEQPVRAEPFDAIELDLSAVWGEPSASPP